MASNNNSVTAGGAVLAHRDQMALRVGQKAPDFDVTSSAGEKLRLADFLGKKNVVLYFYPADFTVVCTRETCGFRDVYGDAIWLRDTRMRLRQMLTSTATP